MEIKSKTIQMIHGGPGIIWYRDWVIIRGSGILAYHNRLSYYNESQLILCIF